MKPGICFGAANPWNREHVFERGRGREAPDITVRVVTPITKHEFERGRGREALGMGYPLTT